MAAVMLSNPGLPLAVLGNPRRRSKRRRNRKNPMSKRTPRFFLRRFKRGRKNPYVSASGYTAGGAFVGKPAVYGKTKSAVEAQLAASGLDVSSMTAVRKSGASVRRRKHRKARHTHTKKARHGRRKHTMAKTHRRSSVEKRLAALRRSRHSGRVGRVFKRTVKGKQYAVKVLRARKGHGKRRKVHAVRWSGKRGSAIYTALSFGSKRRKGTHVIGFTNPRSRKHRARRTSRRNPGIAADYLGGLTGTPTKIMSLFKGKNMAKNALFATGGAVGSFMIGGILSAKVIRPLLEKVAPSFAAQVADPSTIQARLVGGLLPYTAAFAITKLFGKRLGSDLSSALMVGGAVASVIELIRPGMVGDLLKKVGLAELPYAGPALAGLGALSGPVCGLGYSDQLAGYYSSPAYQGQAGIVQAPAYQGSAGLRGYVQDRSQRLSGLGREVLAGTFLDDAAEGALNNNWLTNEGGAADASVNDAMTAN